MPLQVDLDDLPEPGGRTITTREAAERGQWAHEFLERMLTKHKSEVGQAYDRGRYWGDARTFAGTVACYNILMHHWWYVLAWGVATLVILTWGAMVKPQ